MNLSISQNFLVNPALVSELIKNAKICSEDVVFDIGAGKGVISSQLAVAAKEVYTFELDKKFESTLNHLASNHSNIKLILGDFLTYKIPQNLDYKVFSNIPFSITSDIVNKLFFVETPPFEAYLIMQKETALRLLGVGEGTLISKLLNAFFEVAIVHEFKVEDFEPKPAVKIVLLKIKRLVKPLIDAVHKQDFYNFVIYALLQQKPTLKLRLGKIFTSAQFNRLATDLKFDRQIQASELNIKQWTGLFAYYLTGVEPFKKTEVTEIGSRYLRGKSLLQGPSRTKLRK